MACAVPDSDRETLATTESGSDYFLVKSVVPKPMIDFDVRLYYSYNDDVECFYTLAHYRPIIGDRIGIYKSGWLCSKDYILFEWTPIQPNADSDIYRVVFKENSLPKFPIDDFQFCYITHENELIGASGSFQLVHDVNNPHSSKNLESSSSSIGYESINRRTEKQGRNTQWEIKELQEENALLKQSLKVIVSQKQQKNYDKEINELKSMVHTLKDVVNRHAFNIEILTSQVKLCVNSNANSSHENLEASRMADLQHRIRNDLNIAIQLPQHCNLNQVSFNEHNCDLGSTPSVPQSVSELDSIPPLPTFNE